MRPLDDEESITELARRVSKSVEFTQLDKRLELTLQGRTYMARNGDVLGRQGSIAVAQLVEEETVSRRHVIIGYAQGRWSLLVPGSVLNTTRMDGIELPRDQTVPLVSEHLLKLGASVMISIKVID